MKKKRILTLLLLYALTMLFLLLLSVTCLLRTIHQQNETPYSVDTEYIYVYLQKETDPSDTETQSDGGWIVKEYSERIGIFKADGTLIRILDTYTKTLPEADRRMLREGIPIETESQLYSLIEDYTE